VVNAVSESSGVHGRLLRHHHANVRGLSGREPKWLSEVFTDGPQVNRPEGAPSSPENGRFRHSGGIAWLSPSHATMLSRNVPISRFRSCDLLSSGTTRAAVWMQLDVVGIPPIDPARRPGPSAQGSNGRSRQLDAGYAKLWMPHAAGGLQRSGVMSDRRSPEAILS
jgi:hypothetical protein